MRAAFRGSRAGPGPIDEGYHTYSKNALPFVLPTQQRPEIVLPPSDVAWLVEQPESILSSTTIQLGDMGLRYLAYGQSLDLEHDFSVVRSLQAQRYLHSHIPEQMQEIAHAFAAALDPLLSVDKAWTEVAIVKVLQGVTIQVVARNFLGIPICREKQYTKDMQRWAVAFRWSGFVLRTYLPERLKPIIGLLLGIYVRYNERRAIRHIIPTIRRHIFNVKNSIDTKDKPGDVLNWLINRALKSPHPADLDLTNIAGKSLLLHFFAEHTTFNTLSTVLFDLLSYQDYTSLLKELRDESHILLFSAHNPELGLTHSVMLKNIKMTSLIRESLRFNPRSARGLIREVVAPSGVVIPGGLHIPRGCRISVCVSAMQRDPDTTGLPDAGAYQARRYFDGSNIAEPEGQRLERRVETVNERFLSLGLGRHVCPRRHFGGQIMKLILAHALLHYDFEGLSERPSVVERGEVMMEDESVVVKVKRRRRADGRNWEGRIHTRS